MGVRLGRWVIITNTQDQVQDGTLMKTQRSAMNQKGRVSSTTAQQEDSLDLHCC